MNNVAPSAFPPKRMSNGHSAGFPPNRDALAAKAAPPTSKSRRRFVERLSRVSATAVVILELAA